MKNPYIFGQEDIWEQNPSTLLQQLMVFQQPEQIHILSHLMNVPREDKVRRLFMWS